MTCVNTMFSRYNLPFNYSHTPKLFGLSERMVRSIIEKARSMVNGAKMSKNFSGEAV